MIIDSHIHLKHGDAAKTEYSPETIVAMMDAAGIDKAVVFAMSTTTRRSIEMAQEAMEKFPERLIPYVYALPHYERPVLAEIREAITGLGFRGIKIHYVECSLAEHIIDPVIRLAGNLDVPCLIDFGGRLADVERLARSFPGTRIIVAHLGQYQCREESLIDRCLSLAETYPNLYLDASGVVLIHKISEAVQRVGSARVLYGSDGPHLDPDTWGFARKELTKVSSLGLDPVDETAVLGGSISTLLGL